MLARLTKLALAAVFAALAAPAAAGPALLFDAADGRVLYAEDADNQWHPASLTKIMTAYVTFEALKEGKLTMATKIGCSELANSQSPSKIGLPVGAEMTVEKALQALIVKSANDVAVMLAEAVSGSQEAFVERMNATAARLGMTRTKFVNANGLPAPEQVTTARDLAQARRRGRARLSRARAVVVDAGGAARQDAPAHAQRPAHQLRRRRRHEDRLHLRQRLQRGGQRHPRGPQADRRRARRGQRGRAHRARRQPARARLPDAASGRRCSRPRRSTPCRSPRTPRAP